MGQVGALPSSSSSSSSSSAVARVASLDSSSSSSSSSQQLLLPSEGGEDDCAPRARARAGAGAGGGGGESFLRVHWVAVPEPLRARRVNRWRRRPGVLLPMVWGQPSGAPRCTLRQELRGLRRRARLPLQSTGAVTGTDRRCCTLHARRGTAAAWRGRAGTTASEVFLGAQRITACRRRRGVQERRRRPRAAAASALPLCTSALVPPAARAVRPVVGPLN
jgi:hypothetical protein